MAHDIKPNQKHSIITVKLALHSTDPNEIADGLNEFLSPELGEGFIADYALLHTDEPVIVESDEQPEEGDLFVVSDDEKQVVDTSALQDCIEVVFDALKLIRDGGNDISHKNAAVLTGNFYERLTRPRKENISKDTILSDIKSDLFNILASLNNTQQQ